MFCFYIILGHRFSSRLTTTLSHRPRRLREEHLPAKRTHVLEGPEGAHTQDPILPTRYVSRPGSVYGTVGRRERGLLFGVRIPEETDQRPRGLGLRREVWGRGLVSAYVRPTYHTTKKKQRNIERYCIDIPPAGANTEDARISDYRSGIRKRVVLSNGLTADLKQTKLSEPWNG